MAWIIALLIGFILGWGTCMLLDYLFWRNKRICAEAEYELQATVSRLETEKNSLKSLVAKLTDTAEGKDIEVATLRARGQEPAIDPGEIETEQGAKPTAAALEAADSNVPQQETEIDPAARQANVMAMPEVAAAEPAAVSRQHEVDLVVTGADASIEKTTTDTDVAIQYSHSQASKAALEAKVAAHATKPTIDATKVALQPPQRPSLDGNLAVNSTQQAQPARERRPKGGGSQNQSSQPGDVTSKARASQSPADNRLLMNIAKTDTDATEVAVIGEQQSAPGDNLAHIWGIGRNKQKALNEAGIFTFKQLVETPLAELDDLVAKGHNHFNLANQASWPEPARLAAGGQWKELHVLQQRLIAKSLQEAGGFALRDNLREIWGIGKLKQRALYKAGFHIFKQLATTPVSYFDKLVAHDRNHFNLANQGTWPEQARLAASEQWGDLRVLQKKLKAEYQAGRDDLRAIWGIGKKKQKALSRRGIYTFEQLAATPVSDLDELVAKGGDHFNLANQATWPEQAWLAVNAQWEDLHNLQNKLMIEVMPELAAESGAQHDNLREIWGIGKKKQAVLYNVGINTFEQLASTPEAEFDELVTEGHDSFNLANQMTWVEQAQLAADQQWGKLRALQKELKATSRARRDNLREILGIGNKKLKALHKADIYTFEQLATTPVSDFDALMATGESDFNLANQTTWSKQARLAASGNWRALRGYQQTLREQMKRARLHELP